MAAFLDLLVCAQRWRHAVIVAPMVLQHDRYLYLSCYAFCALVAWAILHLANVQIGKFLDKDARGW